MYPLILKRQKLRYVSARGATPSWCATTRPKIVVDAHAFRGGSGDGARSLCPPSAGAYRRASAWGPASTPLCNFTRRAASGAPALPIEQVAALHFGGRLPAFPRCTPRNLVRSSCSGRCLQPLVAHRRPAGPQRCAEAIKAFTSKRTTAVAPEASACRALVSHRIV